MKAVVGALNQEKALLGAFSVIVKTDCETDRFTGVFIMAGFSQGAIYKTDICLRSRPVDPNVVC